MMLPIGVALVEKTGPLPFEEVARAAAAINLQVESDFRPIWNVSATITALPNPQEDHAGCVARLPSRQPAPTEGGVHLTNHHQPYAPVELGPARTLSASHECLEVLADRSGHRPYACSAIQVNGGAIFDALGMFHPSEAYTIDDVIVSDFYTPLFRASGVVGRRYSLTGAVKRPRQVLPGRYLSWYNPETEEVQTASDLSLLGLTDVPLAEEDIERG